MTTKDATTTRKPTVYQRMNRKHASYCANCPEYIFIANTATIATVSVNGNVRYALVHKACEEEYVSIFA
jgi:hypothetical protein